MWFLLLFISSIDVSQSLPNCNFALNFDSTQLFADAQLQHNFLLNASYWEGKFATHLIGINYVSALTYDGGAINYTTGESLRDHLHDFSAASKESIHVGLLALALDGASPYARQFIASSMEQVVDWNGTVDAFVVDMLTKKIGSYERFDAMYPGFGGFVPWFQNNDTGMHLLWDWPDRVPSLDNGELVWALIAAVQVLDEKNYTQLADRYRRRVQMMADYGPMMFYQGDGQLSTVVKIRNVTATPTAGNYYPEKSNCSCDDVCVLDDPYEGETFTFFVDLYGNWSQYAADERDRLWPVKRAKIEKVRFHSRFGEIEVERGWWHSAHEKWKFMELPYFDNVLLNRVFLNGERARTHFSAQNGYPGLFAAAANYSQPEDYTPDYLGGIGIQEIASQIVRTNDLVTPYGAMPLLLHPDTRSYGIVWYASMLKGSKMQGPQGSSESVRIDGAFVSPINTWDTKITNVLAFSGGLIDINRRYMKRASDVGVYDRFNATLTAMWSPLFANGDQLIGSSIAFALPPANVPNVLPAFTSCAAGDTSSPTTTTTTATITATTTTRSTPATTSASSILVSSISTIISLLLLVLFADNI